MANNSLTFRLGKFFGDFSNGLSQSRASGSIHDPSTPVSVALAGLPSMSGVDVNHSSVLGISAVWNAVQQISQDFGTFSKYVYQIDGSTKSKIDHPINQLLKEPNKIQSGPVFFESLALCYQLKGNAIAYIKKRGSDDVELIMLDPDKTEVRISNRGNIFYSSKTMYGIKDEIEYKNLSANEVIHIPNLTYNGIWGNDIVRQFKDALGLSKAQENYNNELYVNGGSPQMAITYPGQLPDGTADKVNEKFARDYAGAGKHHKVFVTGEGAEIKQLSFNPEQMSFLKSREFSVEEIARMTNMPLHKIKSMRSSTNNNIEWQSKEYYQDTQQPIIAKFEAELNRKLLPPSERKTTCIQWDMDDILRADVKTRYEAYGKAATFRILTTNEIRAKEGFPPTKDGDGFIDFQSPANSADNGK